MMDDANGERRVEPKVGSITVVSTPIGNLGDITARAVEVLRVADVILCEDTRRTRALLSALGIPAAGRLRSLHEHNEINRTSSVLAAVASGSSLAIVSDAGTPAISDPGGHLVAAAAAQGLVVTVAPGASAVLAALVVSGMPTERFCMEGFIPRKGRDRKEALEVIASDQRTTVLYEAPGRLMALLVDLAGVVGDDRPVVICRELTKLHEEVWRGTLGDAVAVWTDREVRGEVVVVLGGAPPTEIVEVDDQVLRSHLADSLAGGLSKRDAADAAARELGVARRRAYEAATSLG